MTPEDTKQLFKSIRPQAGADDDEISEEETELRTSKLKEVLLHLQSAWQDGAGDIDLIAVELGDGARDASWRLPIGNSGILDFFLTLLPKGLAPGLMTQILRIIGNSCADTDENRARVVQSGKIPALVYLFRQVEEVLSLLPYIVPVLYNVCVDYEPAQLEFSRAGLSGLLVDLISRGPINTFQTSVSHICKILEMLAGQAPELEVANRDTPHFLLKLAIELAKGTDLLYDEDMEVYDIELFSDVLSATLAYLSHELFQTAFLTSGEADCIFYVFYKSQEFCNCYLVFNNTDDQPVPFKTVRATLLNFLADFCARPDFLTYYPLDQEPIFRLVNWLGHDLLTSQDLLVEAACLCLGNLARSDSTATSLLDAAFSKISWLIDECPPEDPAPRHALLSFLKNLAIPQANKEKLGSLLLEDAFLATIWSDTSHREPRGHFLAVSLTRLLITNCPANVALLLNAPNGHSDETCLQYLFDVTPGNATEPTRFELARTTMAVCKTVHSYPPADREDFYDSHGEMITSAISTLMTQAKFPALRSEALFIMALMSRSAEGAEAVREALDAEVMRVVVEAVTGKKTVAVAVGEEQTTAENEAAVAREGGEMDAILGLEPKQVDSTQSVGMARIDRENGLVLVAEILKQSGELLSDENRGVFEQVLKTGGQMVIDDRESDA